MLNFGRAIKLVRTQKDISQLSLAETAGLSVSYVSLLERNKRDPNLSTIEKLADALCIPLPILFFLAGAQDGISPELAEKLSAAVIKIIKAA